MEMGSFCAWRKSVAPRRVALRQVAPRCETDDTSGAYSIANEPGAALDAHRTWQRAFYYRWVVRACSSRRAQQPAPRAANAENIFGFS
jgi:hypothetical protein